MQKSSIKKIVYVVALLFVACFLNPVAHAEDINLNHNGKAVIKTESVEAGKKLDGMVVQIYQIASLDESSAFAPVAAEIDLSATGSRLLEVAKTLKITGAKTASENGIAIFDDLKLGVYVVEIPDQTIGGVVYGADPFIIEIPVKTANNHSYLIEATPKISEHKKEADVDPVPVTSSQSYLDVWLLIIIGALLVIVGIGVKKHGSRQSNQ